MLAVSVLLLFFGLALLSGVSLAARAPRVSFLARALAVFTVAAAQVLLTIEALSLVYELRPIPLFLLNAGLTALCVLATRFYQLAWRTVLLRPLVERLANFRRLLISEPLSGGMLVLSLVSVIVFSISGFMSLSYGDSYHFAMPLFWKQHASVLPFPATNPRTICLVFAAEGLAFPGVLYAQSLALFYVLAAAAKVFSIGIVIGTARLLGASRPAAMAAGALVIAYLPMTSWSPDLLLAAMWFAASIYLLLEADINEPARPWLLGTSVLSVLMACGAKNVVILQVPLYLAFALGILYRRLFTWRALQGALVGGAVGLLCSTFLWNFVSNKHWYGNARGPAATRATLAADFSLPAVWTRIVRGTVHSFVDPTWLPRTLRAPYGESLTQLVRATGGREQLPDDNSAGYSFTGEILKPGTGLGFLGLPILATSLVAGLWAARAAAKSPQSTPEYQVARRKCALALLVAGSFLLFYIFLRTQSIGITRLMTSCIVVGGPLAAVLLQRRELRSLGALALGASLLIQAYTALMLMTIRVPSMQATRLGLKADRILSEHAVAVDYCWSGEPVQKKAQREPSSPRECYEQLLSRLPASVQFGSLGTHSSEEFFLFGPQFSHQVFCLRDERHPEQILPIPDTVDYLVSDSADVGNFNPGTTDFAPFLEVQRAGDRTFVAYQRIRGKSNGNPP